MIRRWAGSLTWLPVLLLTATTAESQGYSEKVNRGVVGLIAGSIDGTSMRAASDLSIVLDDGENLRVVPSQGKGSVQAISDLLFLRGIDVAIIQRDALEYGRRESLFPNIDTQVRYITKLFNEEVHIVARQDINSIDDLKGKPVNIGMAGSGSDLTGSLIFELLHIPIVAEQSHHTIALRKLIAGEIAAMVYIGGQPTPLFEKIRPEDGLHLLPIGYTPELIDLYLPASINPDSYPGLNMNGLTVDTIAVEAVMAVYNWAEDHPRHAKVKRFVDAFFSQIDKLREEPWHIKWLGVNPHAELKGWRRFGPAEDWLEAEAAVAQPSEAAFEKFLAERDLVNVPDELRQGLFDVFKKQQQQADDDQFVFALVPESVNNAYSSAVRDGCVRAGEELGDVQCLYIGPGEHDPQEQAQILQQMVEQEVDGIATSPSDSPVVAGVLRRAKETGIPVIVFDNDLKTADRDLRYTFLGTNSYEMGAEMARRAMDYKPRGGKVCIALDTEEFRGRGAVRLQAIRATLSGGNGIERLNGENGWVEPEGCPIVHEGDTQIATQSLARILARHPDLDLFIATDNTTQSADDDFRTVMAPYLPRLSNGSLRMIMPDTLDVQMGQLRDGLTSVQISQRPFETGYRAMYFLHDIMDGYEIMDPMYTSLDVCTQETASVCVTTPGEGESVLNGPTALPVSEQRLQ